MSGSCIAREINEATIVLIALVEDALIYLSLIEAAHSFSLSHYAPQFTCSIKLESHTLLCCMCVHMRGIQKIVILSHRKETTPPGQLQ